MIDFHSRATVVAFLCAGMCLAELGASVRPVRAEHLERVVEQGEQGRRYNAEYIFAATYGLTDMPVPAALKVPLVPVTLVMDVALLPFEVVAGCF
jgi:uncharacterized protein YceK